MGVKAVGRPPHPPAEAAMTLRVSCPYCNTSFALAGVPPTGRAACPRCGDTFAVKPPEDDSGESGDVSPASRGREPPVDQVSSRTTGGLTSPGSPPRTRPPTLRRLLAVGAGV